MRRFLSLVAVVALAACSSSSTGPASKAGDPSLLITNNLQSDYVYITWQDGAAIIGHDSVAPRTANQCVRFTAQPDSAYWSITASDPNLGTSNMTAPYFNPSDRPAWNVVVSEGTNASPAIVVTLVNTPC